VSLYRLPQTIRKLLERPTEPGEPELDDPDHETQEPELTDEDLAGRLSEATPIESHKHLGDA
jgi:hypothetical protein